MESVNELLEKAKRLRMIGNLLLTVIGAASVMLAYAIVTAA